MIRDKEKGKGQSNVSAYDKGRGDRNKEDKSERSDTVRKSDENVTGAKVAGAQKKVA